MSGYEPEDDWVCGESFDHDLRMTYEGEDGHQYECRRCGAELWEDADDTAAAQGEER